MKQLLLLVILLAVTPTPAPAQDTPKVELFGGYVYCRTDGPIGSSNFDKNLNGWEASANVNLIPWLGVECSVSGVYGRGHETQPVFVSDTNSIDSNTHLYTYLVGPRFSVRGHRITPFGHALFGAAHVNQSVNGTYSFLPEPGPHTFAQYDQTRFSATVGGGIDVRLTDQISLRVLQADYLRTQFDTPYGVTGQNGLRLTTGLVFAFGK